MQKIPISTILALLILGLIFTWTAIETIILGYTLSIKHISALIFLTINALLFIFSIRWGVLFTFILLLAGTFDAVHFFRENVATGFFLRGPSFKISTPSVNFWILPLLMLHGFLNWRFMMDLLVNLGLINEANDGPTSENKS